MLLVYSRRVAMQDAQLVTGCRGNSGPDRAMLTKGATLGSIVKFLSTSFAPHVHALLATPLKQAGPHSHHLHVAQGLHKAGVSWCFEQGLRAQLLLTVPDARKHFLTVVGSSTTDRCWSSTDQCSEHCYNIITGEYLHSTAAMQWSKLWQFRRHITAASQLATNN